ncbi:hypothetical protein EBR96_01155, partial [bacterium]|nr:hypothetical protein [bacterium]
MLIAVSPIFGTPIVRDIRYSHNGNFLGKLLIPENKSGPAPVIIYVYDEFVDRVGESFAAKRRYDINRHMMEYGKWNAIVIIPMERYRKLNAIQGAIEYARSLPGADPNRIHLVGVSEGGILCLRAAERGKVRTVTVITSSEIADKG